MTIAGANQAYPFMIAEFEVNGMAVHEDHLVIASEAVYELNSMIARLCECERDLGKLRTVVALVNDTNISFRIIRPQLSEDGSLVYYTETDPGMVFRLGHPDLRERIMEACRLIVYIRTTVCEAGKDIAALAADKTTTGLFDDRLPRLPLTGAPARLHSTQYTPLKGRRDEDKHQASSEAAILAYINRLRLAIGPGRSKRVSPPGRTMMQKKIFHASFVRAKFFSISRVRSMAPAGLV
ncbi:hypothetical protein DFJ77DRAFT_239035 [Powellomyces hirtus]|nr:hypothetical protein DFJ77DRAFT_239035 [Powellomyces hirtus]